MNDLFEIYLFQFLNISLSNIIGFITIVVYNVYKLYNVLYAFVHYYTLKFSRGIESKIISFLISRQFHSAIII